MTVISDTPVSGQAFFREGPYARFMEAVTTCSTLTVRKGQWPAGHFPDPPLADFNLQLAIETSNKPFTADMGAGRFTHIFVPGDIHLAPPKIACDYRSEGPVRVLSVHFEPEFLTEVTQDLPGGPLTDFAPLHARAFRDPFIESAVHKAWRASLDKTPAHLLLADSLKLGIVTALVSQVTPDTHHAPHATRRSLRPQDLRRALEYVDAGLETPLRLKDWAATLGLSPFSFTRAFKAAMGISPHQYVIQQRLKFSQRLILETRLPLSEVAVAAGFANQAHMTRLFRRFLTFTPASLRRSS